ncbi:alpha/beta hydrolase [Phenylobacterium sp. J426]|uniref:lysophospholipase n=1 Tax=Phenylobacterium sp. J426 TaxID=2898439 RepID=UPI002150EAC8|nr:lysophospholipase [Phenylobacterium sp. J426]MCR5872735.1 alpha/beta hydrolase [Phenylobacterium sp. J426]
MEGLSELLAKVDTQFLGFASPTAPRIQAGGHPCQGIYWTPKGQKPKAAFIATHYNVDFSEHYIAPYLATRGFGFLGWNTRYRGFEDQFLLEHAILDISVGMKWLRDVAGVETIIILGNSGGGSLMGAYQGEAIKPTMTHLLTGAAAEAYQSLPRADLYVSLNAHQGRPEVLTDWMDASVIDETDPVATDPELDPFSEANTPPYSQEFIAKYRAAQRARNQRITDWAKAELKRLNEAGIPDRVFPLFRCWGDLRMMDGTIDPSDRATPMCYRGHPAVANKTPSIGRANNIKTWLSMWSLETSNCQGRPHLQKFTQPALVVQGTADTGVFPQDARDIHSFLGSKDKTLELIPGAHYFEDSPEVRNAAASLVADWARARL